jgi:hypothetical protein
VSNLPADPVTVMVATPLAVLMMVADTEAEMHRSDMGAEDVGACHRPANQGQGEERGDQQFH